MQMKEKVIEKTILTWLKKTVFLHRARSLPSGALMLNCDNQSAIKQSVRSFDQKMPRHVGMRMHHLRSQCHRG